MYVFMCIYIYISVAILGRDSTPYLQGVRILWPGGPSAQPFCLKHVQQAALDASSASGLHSGGFCQLDLGDGALSLAIGRLETQPT